ncbi:DnaJ (Hsp40), sub C, member 17 [Gaertneriomyces sp. JEL0708]|nr:DnaJ (Hsp40), sub C, member 17 [Gaertneriomyces sp. JEL0708]
MASSDTDYYALLDISYDATIQQIQKAYRKTALKFHPDKVGPDDTKAAEMFHLLSLATETLTDPTKRSAYDALYKARIAQKARMDKMDSLRRRARNDLEEREKAAKRSKDEAYMATVQRHQEIERIREEGLRKARAEEEQRRQMSNATLSAGKAARNEEIKKHIEESATVRDCTLKVKWKHKLRSFTEDELESIFRQYGSVEKVIISAKRKGSAMIIFDSIFAAEAAMNAQATDASALLQLSWAEGQVPKLLHEFNEKIAQSSEQRTAETSGSSSATRAAAFTPSFTFNTYNAASTNVLDDDYEMITLRKMQQAAAQRATAAATVEPVASGNGT